MKCKNVKMGKCEYVNMWICEYVKKSEIVKTLKSQE